MMFRAQSTNSFQCCFVPDLSNRIVRITENHQRCLRICELLFQVFEINVICISVEYKRTFQHLSAIIQNRVKEYIIHWCLHQYLFGWCCQLPHNRRDCRYNTGTKHQPVLLHCEIMSDLPPVDIRLIPCIRNLCIAETTMLRTLANCFHNCRRCLEIHIRYPHRKLAFCHVPFHGIRIGTIYYFIKIICHNIFSICNIHIICHLAIV